MAASRHLVRFDGSRFWIVHRRCEFGPFDYEWSADFRGVEFVFQGRKFGEYCSQDEIEADLKEFQLPMSVVRIASVVMGCTLYGVFHGFNDIERRDHLKSKLEEYGFAQYQICDA